MAEFGEKIGYQKRENSWKCRISDTCFTSLVTIGRNLYMIHPKNLNNVHKDVNDILSVVFILVTDVQGGETVFLWNDYEW